MTHDTAISAAGRTETARHLIAQSQAENVDLVIVSALDLCVLDGPRQPVFDQRVTRAWMQVTDRQRRKITEEVTASLVRRGLLTGSAPQHHGAAAAVSSYAFKPELGLMLAARCRPAFAVIAQGERQGLRAVSMFALGDQADPVRAIVAELPAGLPREYPHNRKLGPLGWIYRYVLVSPDNAADLLARWTMTPPAQPGGAAPLRYLVSAYRPDRDDPAGCHLGVRADGTGAVVDGPGTGSAQYDLDGLRAVMLGLLAGAAR
jgi:hypothetical protein